MATSDILGLSLIAENQGAKHLTHNESILQLEGILLRVLSRSNGGAPGSPSNGDTYVVDDASGDWSGASVDDIAHYYGGNWHFYTPIEGLNVWCIDESVRIYYNGSDWSVQKYSTIDLSVSLLDHGYVGVSDQKNVVANTVGFGGILMLDSSGDLTDANATDNTGTPAFCMVLESGTGTKIILTWGRVKNTSWSLTPGQFVYVGLSDGAFTQTKPSSSGNMVQVIGVAEASDTIFLNPSYVTIEIS